MVFNFNCKNFIFRMCIEGITKKVPLWFFLHWYKKYTKMNVFSSLNFFVYNQFFHPFIYCYLFIYYSFIYFHPFIYCLDGHKIIRHSAATYSTGALNRSSPIGGLANGKLEYRNTSRPWSTLFTILPFTLPKLVSTIGHSLILLNKQITYRM